MKDSNHYETPAAFRQALESRLNQLAASEAVDVQRLRRQVAFDRLLTRLFQSPGSSWALKGGYAMELRIAAARTTRDIDLTLTLNLESTSQEAMNVAIRQRLQESVTGQGPDYFEFLIGPPQTDLDAAPYGGARFPVEVRLAGRIFARFHIDVAVGDVVVEPLVEVHGRDWFSFAGISAISFRAISAEQQFAEKVHAYSLPREKRVNSRVRDLVDLYLLVGLGLDASGTQNCLMRTFSRRRTHPRPEALDPPPPEWTGPYAELARECGISPDMGLAFQTVTDFLRRL